MLSAKALTEAEVRSLVRRDLSELAPRFRAAVQAALADCHRDGLDATVYEALRSDEVQRSYYALGRTVVPPTYTVTNARTALGSWHAYGLAVDVISASRGWGFSREWIEGVAARFRRHGCDWGGDWRQQDLPHFQWGRCGASPSARARELLASAGLPAVWCAVGADDARPAWPEGLPLRRGDRGPAVAWLQRRLQITADGVFGPGTEAAVRGFQRRAGLVADGVVGARTAAALAG